MARRGDTRRHAKDVTHPNEATKPELVTAILHLIGGDTRFVVLDELAIACHRLAPSVFSWPQYHWLPSLDSVRVTLVDVRRMEMIDEGSAALVAQAHATQGPSPGRAWVARNGVLLENLRQRLPDLSRYLDHPAGELVAVAILSAAEAGEEPPERGLSQERLVAEAYRLFPERFALGQFMGWPDSASVERAARDCPWLSSSPEGWSLKSGHRDAAARLREQLHVRSAQGFGATKRKMTQGTAHRAVRMLERSPLWKRYLDEGPSAAVSDEDVCDILSVTLESTPDTVRKHLDSMLRLSEQAERWDLQAFLKWLGEWCQQREFKLVQP